MSLCKTCQEALPDFPSSDGVGDAPIVHNGPSPKLGIWEKKKDPKQPSQAQWFMKGRFSLHSSWDMFVASLEADCPLCWSCWRVIRSSPIASPSDERVADFQATITYAHFDIKDDLFNIWVGLEGTGWKTMRLRLNITKTSRELFEETECKNPIPAQHTAQSAAEVANRWIGVCDKNHPSCLARATPPSDAKLPTRLLDLGTSDSTTWRIIETQQERLPYVALSHRWTENTPTLLQKNYDAYCDSQPDGILPPNYRDMLDICRALPIRYIWIDSLCIIQDDNGADFRHEAPIMLDVYRYAFLTLMILWEFSDSTVFRNCRPSTIARPRPQSYKRPALTETSQDTLFTYLKNLVVSQGDSSSQGSMSSANNYAFVRVENTGSYNLDVNNAPINKRAWVVQERCLSRRILCFGNEELYWECEGDSSGPFIASEASPLGVPHMSRRHDFDSLTGNDGGEYWNLLVEQYSACHLTFEEDRLVAFSGIARAVAESTGDTYLAGIWLETWMQDLLWMPDVAREQPARVKPTTVGTQSMVLPSWSWMSFSGSIIPGLLVANGEGPRISMTEPDSFKSDRFDCLALLSQRSITPPETDPYVLFHRAILRVRCLLIPVEFTGIADMHKLPSFFRITQNIESNSAGLDYLSLIPCREREDGYAVFTLSFSKPLNEAHRYFFIPLFLRKDKYQEVIKFGPDDTEGHGIIVEETVTDGELIDFPRNCTSQLDQDGVYDEEQNGIGADENGRLGENLRGELQLEKEQIMADSVKCSDLPHFSNAEWSSVFLVYNLSWDTTEDDLLDAFSERYEVEKALVIRDTTTGRSRRYAFVFFDSPEGAVITKQYLDNTDPATAYSQPIQEFRIAIAIALIVMRDRDSGNSRGIGFVTYANPMEASAAIGALNNQEEIAVNLADARPTGGSGGGFGGGQGGSGGGYQQGGGYGNSSHWEG
ncbi:hypothetical protein FCOIX_11976 [Fusarium coicis]|nr:hypothetical protein FCOIX_11976 [Fusarium coicis]